MLFKSEQKFKKAGCIWKMLIISWIRNNKKKNMFSRVRDLHECSIAQINKLKISRYFHTPTSEDREIILPYSYKPISN